MKRLIALSLFVCSYVCAQTGRSFVAYKDASLSAAASVVTVQAPATGGARVVRFVGAYIYCSVACDITLERNGTAATATALTLTPINSTVPAAVTTAFHTSDVGVGTVIAKYSIAAGGDKSIDLTSFTLLGNGTTKNLTLRSSSVTGTIRTVIQCSEDM